MCRIPLLYQAASYNFEELLIIKQLKVATTKEKKQINRN